VVEWNPTKNKQAWLWYDLNNWKLTDQQGPLALEIHTVAWERFLGPHLGNKQLLHQRWQALISRGIVSMVFHFGVRKKGWGEELYPEIGETLNRAMDCLLENAGKSGSGCKVWRWKAVVSCALAANMEVAKQLLAQLGQIGNNGEKSYIVATTDEAVPKNEQEDGKTDKPASHEAGDAGKVHQFFHDTMGKFTADAKATLASLQPHLKTLLITNPPATYEGKRLLVDGLNKLFHAADMALKHPDGNDAVTLLAKRGGARNRKGYFQIRPTKGGDLFNLPDQEPRLIHFHRYRSEGGGPGLPAK